MASLLSRLIPSRLRRDALSLFFSNPDCEFHLREVSRRAGTSPNAAKAELESLVSAGILKEVRRGNMRFFSVEKKSPVYLELRGLVLKTEGIAGALRNALAKVSGIRLAFIYGSFAEGRENAKSDIDVFIVGKPEEGEVARAVREAEAKLGREVSVSVYPESELIRKKESGFISSVLRGEKIWLAGGPDELKRLAEKRAVEKD